MAKPKHDHLLQILPTMNSENVVSKKMQKSRDRKSTIMAKPKHDSLLMTILSQKNAGKSTGKQQTILAKPKRNPLLIKTPKKWRMKMLSKKPQREQ